MNREIKFRMWSNHFKAMNYNPALWGYSRGGIDELNTSLNRMQENEKNSLMQFTGLTDKNGKEIYEGAGDFDVIGNIYENPTLIT